MESTQTGGCACGAIRYQFASSRWCAHDYSRLSTHMVGAPVATWTGIRFDRLIFTAGEELLTTYDRDDRTVGFCSKCGTTLTVRSGLWPEDVHVSTVTIDAPYRTPSANLFIDQTTDWQPVNNDLPGFGGENGRESIGERSIRDRIADVHPNVRIAARWDATAILSLMQEHSHRATPSDSAELKRDLITYLDSGAPGFFLVAEEDNRVVGYADIKYLPQTAAAGYHVQLFDVCITPESSLGGALLDVTKAIATFLGTTTLTAGIPTNDSGTAALLDQAGFRVTPEAIWEFQS